jgi:thiamine-phosphate diphosphorylase
VNDRADVALAARAHGVHLRADSLPVAAVRHLSSRLIVGKSVHAGSPGAPDADYLFFGTVFGTTSKPGATPVGLTPLSALASSVSQPVLAIGGITPERAAACRRAGAAGIAAIGAFLPEGTAPGALGVAAAVRAFRVALGAL